MDGFKGERSSTNEEFVHAVTERNVVRNIEIIRAESSILKEMEDRGAIAIVGALYDMDNGEVTFLP